MLQSLLELALLPPGSIIALLLASIVATLRSKRLGIGLAAVAMALLWLASMPVVSQWALGALESVHAPVAVGDAPSADAILVLGGGFAPHLPPRTSSELVESSDRLRHAARLHRARRAPVVVASGGVPPMAASDEPEALTMATLLQEFDVPREAVLMEDRSRDTRENCAYSAELLRAEGMQRVLLVTSARHMPRALATCRSAGLDAAPAATDVLVVSEPSQPLPWAPDAASLLDSARALHEYAGILVYAARGWLDLRDLGQEPEWAATPPPPAAPSP